MVKSGHIIFDQQDEVIFGQPAATTIRDVVLRLGKSRIFLMVSGTLNRDTDEIEKIRTALGGRYAGTFDAMPAHTSRQAVVAASEQARKLEADLIITVGGGSVTDGAKAVQLGGEFTAISGITNEETKTKELYRHPKIIPQIVILDPAVTLHTPEWLWLSTGIRAVDNCVEGVCSKKCNPYGDAHGLKGLSLLSQELRRVKEDPTNLEARLGCQMGAWLSGGPFKCGAPMGASHGIGYVLGSMYGVPHGHTSCVMLPSVMRWNKKANPELQAKIAAAMGYPDKEAGDLLEALIADLGMPGNLTEVGIDLDNLETIAEASMSIPWIPHNPRPIPTSSELMEILKLAM